MKRGYSLKTEKLLQRIERVNLRQEYVFDVPKITKILKKAYALFNLSFPEIVACKDITDERFTGAARAAGATWATWAAGATWATWAAGATWATWAARATWATWAAGAARAAGATRATRAAGATWAAGAARAAGTTRAAGATWAAGAAGAAGATRAAGIDYEFDNLVFEHEYLQTNKGNEDDHKAIKAYMLFLEAKEAGLGYLAEENGKLYICPNPILKMNDRLQYHSLEYPAIEWKDGLKIYYISGIKIEENLWNKIKNKQLEKEDWLNQKNLEVRRIIQEQMGEDFVLKIGGRTISKHKNPKIGEIIEVDITPDPEKIAHYLKAKDWSTERVYYLRIPPNISDPVEAQKWSYDWPEFNTNILRT